MIRLFLSDVATPFYRAAFVFAAVVTLYCVIALARTRGKVPSTRLGRWIAALPFIAGLIPFAAFMENLGFTCHNIFFDASFRATGDPRVHASWIVINFMSNVISLAILICFLAVWLVLRAVFLRRNTAAG